jgi:diguanylate cyclase (GGDEF)-like protein
MCRHKINRLSHLVLGTLMSLCIGVAAGAASDQAPLPSASGFDALFKRLDYGDLSIADPPQQRRTVGQLQQMMPPDDPHRQRLLDSKRCSLDFVDANASGFAFADAKLAEALKAKDTGAAIRFYYCRGDYQENIASPNDALADYDRGIGLARDMEDSALLATGLSNRGQMLSIIGVHGKALADLLESRRLFEQLGLTEPASQSFLNIGTAYRRLGYPDKAREYLKQSIEHSEHVGDHGTLGASLAQLGFIDEESGHYDNALAAEQRSLEMTVANGDRSNIASTKVSIASVLNHLHRYQDALKTLDEAEAEFAAIGDHSYDGMASTMRGSALAGLGQHRKAIESFTRAETTTDIQSNPRYQEILYDAKARSLEASGQPALALEAYKRYLTAHEEVTRQRTDEQAQMLREQFDSDRSNLENARLKAEQTLKDRQVEALQRVRAWQQAAMVLLAILLALLALFVIRQLGRLRSWKRMASIDPLTGVANRRGVEQFTALAMREARVRREPLSVLAIDIDEFKRINDSLGHAAGDKVLIAIARACEEALREGDLLGRIGGEEFLVVLPRGAVDHAADIAERLRRRVETLPLDEIAANLRATVSVGVAEMSAGDSGFPDLEQRADAALYRAKAAGRNRVVSAAADESITNSGKRPEPKQAGS